jgi:hypothetical protein
VDLKVHPNAQWIDIAEELDLGPIRTTQERSWKAWETYQPNGTNTESLCAVHLFANGNSVGCDQFKRYTPILEVLDKMGYGKVHISVLSINYGYFEDWRMSGWPDNTVLAITFIPPETRIKVRLNAWWLKVTSGEEFQHQSEGEWSHCVAWVAPDSTRESLAKKWHMDCLTSNGELGADTEIDAGDGHLQAKEFVEWTTPAEVEIKVKVAEKSRR